MAGKLEEIKQSYIKDKNQINPKAFFQRKSEYYEPEPETEPETETE